MQLHELPPSEASESPLVNHYSVLCSSEKKKNAVNILSHFSQAAFHLRYLLAVSIFPQARSAFIDFKLRVTLTFLWITRSSRVSSTRRKMLLRKKSKRG